LKKKVEKNGTTTKKKFNFLSWIKFLLYTTFVVVVAVVKKEIIKGTKNLKPNLLQKRVESFLLHLTFFICVFLEVFYKNPYCSKRLYNEERNGVENTICWPSITRP
jgi:hypothetical protein